MLFVVALDSVVHGVVCGHHVYNSIGVGLELRLHAFWKAKSHQVTREAAKT